MMSRMVRRDLSVRVLLPGAWLLLGCPYEVATTTDTDGTGDPGTSTSVGTTAPTESSPSTGEASVCGDGVVGPRELCDDGNDEPDDGCDADCTRTGAALWTYTHNGAAGEGDGAVAVAIDSTGRVLIAGYEGVTAGDSDALLIALGPDGKELWRKTFAGAAMLGDTFETVVVDEAGRIYVGGREETAPQVYTAIVRGFEADGAERWVYADPSPAMKPSYVNDMAIVDGWLYSSGSDDLMAGAEVVVRRHDLATGETMWRTSAPGEGLVARGYGVAPLGEGIIVVGGTYDEDSNTLPLVITLDKAGEIVATRAEDHPGGLWTGVARVGDAGDVVMVGRRVSPGDTGVDMAIRRVGPDLAEKWTVLVEHDLAFERATGVATGPGEQIFVSGIYVKAGQFDNIFGGFYEGDGTNVWTHHADHQELYDYGQGVAFGPDSVVLAGMVTAIGEDTNLWVRAFAAG